MFGLMPWRREAARPVLRREDPLTLFRRELDTLFDAVFGDGAGLFDVEPRPWGLKLEDLEKEVVIRAEAPGFEVGDFEVHVAGDVLTIAAEPKVEKGKPEERRYISMRRSVLLPPGLDVDKVEAIYRNGVLEIHLPRKPEAMARRIDVKP